MEITNARPFRRIEERETPFTFTLSGQDLQRDWSLTFEARERIVKAFGLHRGWSLDEIRTHLDSLRVAERERLRSVVEGDAGREQLI